EAPRVRLARELVETDLVVVVSAAETVLHGGPATLLAAADAETQRRATAESLLATGGSEGWRLATLVERTLAARVPLFGVPLVLNAPTVTGVLRGHPTPLLAPHLGLAHALGLWRDAFPVRDGGIVILVHRFRRTFARPTQQPYHVFFRSDPIARDPELLAAAEDAVAADANALEEYRAGRTVHPLLPFRDWEACRPALERLDAVYVAGARDAAAVRPLGFVPIGG